VKRNCDIALRKLEGLFSEKPQEMTGKVGEVYIIQHKNLSKELNIPQLNFQNGRTGFPRNNFHPKIIKLSQRKEPEKLLNSSASK
jgi:hypothetical protein